LRLVLGTPSSQPFQTYSHYVAPDGLVQSFIDSVPVGTASDIRIGGTLAPTVRIELNGNNTYVVEELDYGYISALRNRVFIDENT
jgi:levansucrase